MRPERTIVLLKQFLGDAVMTEPLLSTLADNFSHVDVHALPVVQQVLSHLDGKVSFVRAEKIKGLRETMHQARRLRLKGYDMAFLVNRSFGAAVLARLAKIPIRIGHGTEGRSFLLTDSVPYLEDQFEADSYLDLAKAANLTLTRLKPELKLSEPEKKKGLQLAHGATVAFQPGARYASKQISSQTLGIVAARLQSAGHRLVLIGGADEVEAAAALQSQLPAEVVDLVGKTTIRETMAVLGSVKAVLGADTGVMHLAAGLHTPTVTAFGPTPVLKWGHRYHPHEVIEAPNGDLAQLDPEVLLSATLRALGEA